MAKKKTEFSYVQYEEMIAVSSDRRELAAFIIIAMGQWKDKSLSDLAFAGLLEKVASRIYELK